MKNTSNGFNNDFGFFLFFKMDNDSKAITKHTE